MNNACARDAFSQQLASLDVMSPEEFDKVMDDLPSKTREKGMLKSRKKR
jgi:BMFP domain-containing protein YqiC